MRELTPETKISLSDLWSKVTGKPAAFDRPTLTKDTKIRIRLTRDSKDANGKEHSDKNGQFVSKGQGESRSIEKETEKSELRKALESQNVDKKKLASITKKSMSPEQRKAVYRYTGEAHEAINDFCRNGTPNADAERDAKLIKEGIKNTKIPDPMIVHRKCHDDYLMKIFNLDELTEESMQGKEAKDNGIISTSLKQNPNGIKGKNSIYFNLPAGYNAAYIENFTQHKGQQEVILLCETKFKPKSIRPNERGGYDIKVDL